MMRAFAFLGLLTTSLLAIVLAALLALIFIMAAARPASADVLPAPGSGIVRVKDIGRLEGREEHALVGFGLVTGLSGSGDSPNNEVTQQMLRNVLSRLGLNVAPEQIRSRNVAAVTVTAVLPPSAQVGDKIDATISSIGDARSLVGGTLLMTPLLGPDQRPYAIAQGQVAVGGHRFDSFSNREQRNYPASGLISGGATIETSVSSAVVREGGELHYVLRNPDFTTAVRVADAINAEVGSRLARVRDAHLITIDVAAAGDDVYRLISRIEAISVRPDDMARIVVNERSGTVVAGGDVQISNVVISQGDVRISVVADVEASQPFALAGILPQVRSLIVTNTRLNVAAGEDAVAVFPNTTVADLLQGLSELHVDTRRKIAILQALKSAGALHAEIIVQ
jgi:flagellar P-ring protein precursor FlgI